MIGSDHIIGKTVFVIDVPSRKLSDLAFSVVSRIFNELLPGPLSALLDDLHTDTVHLRIERLVVDIGTLSRYDLENNLSEILINALKEQLRMQLLKDTYNPALSDTSSINYFLRYYFSTGRYPWWASAFMVAKSPAAWLYEYVRNNDAAGKSLLKALLRDPVSSKRLFLQADADRLNIPELLVMSPDAYDASDYAVSGYSREEWLWYFLELGRFPTGATPLSVREVFESLIQLVRERPEITLSRMQEITRRRPWALSRLVYLAEETILRELASLWSGMPVEDLASAQSGWDGYEVSEKEIWKEILFQLLSEPESVRGKMSELLSGVAEKLMPELSENFDEVPATPAENMWHYLEAGSHADGIPAESLTAFLKILKEEFRQAPLLSAARLREIVRRKSWSLSVLTRLADLELVRLIFSAATGLSVTEMEKLPALRHTHKSLEKEMWSELLYLVFTAPDSERIPVRELLPDLIDSGGDSVRTHMVKPGDNIWYFLEKGRTPDNKPLSEEQKTQFLQQAGRQPVIFISRLRELRGAVALATDRLVRMYNDRDLLTLIAALSGLEGKLVVRRIRELSAGLHLRVFIRELLEWVLMSPSSRRSGLREILNAPVPEVQMPDEGGREQSYTPEEYVWQYLETGKYSVGHGPVGLYPGDVIMQLAAKKPVSILSKLQEIAGKRPEVFVRLMNIYNTEQLSQLVRVLSGSPLSSLDRIDPTDRLVLREILETALRWLLAARVSERRKLETELSAIISRRLPETARSIIQDYTDEDLLWYYIEFGLIPGIATETFQGQLLELFMSLAGKYPALVLFRLREIFRRRPWILSRLSLQCSPGYLAELLFALSGIRMNPAEDAYGGTDLSFRDQWMEYLRWILENQFSDKEEILMHWPVPTTIRTDEDGTFSLEELLWYYLENWELPDFFQLNRVVQEDELFDFLIEISGRYPVHVRSRLREISLLYTSFIPGLSDRLNDGRLLQLISQLTGLPTASLTAISGYKRLSASARFSPREFRISILQQLISGHYSPGDIASFAGSLLTSLTNQIEQPLPTRPEVSFWGDLEAGRSAELTEDRLSVLFRLAEQYPVQTILRLSHIISNRPSVWSMLVLRLDEKGMVQLLTTFTGLDAGFLERYQEYLQRYGIPVKPALEEILRAMVTHPYSDRISLTKFTVEMQVSGVTGAGWVYDVRKEDLLWSFMENVSLPARPDDPVAADIGNYFTEMAGSSPAGTLLKLKELARKNPQWLNDFLGVQPIEALERAVSYLSGTDLPTLRVRLGEIPGITNRSDTAIRGIWVQALKWLVYAPISWRTDLAHILTTITDYQSLSARQNTLNVMPLTSDALREDLFRSFMEDGSPPSSVDATNIDLLDYFSATAGRSPLDTLLKLKDLARKNPQWLSDFLMIQSAEALERAVSYLSGTDLPTLRDRLGEIPGITNRSDSAIRGIWIQALIWLISNPVSRRTALEGILPAIIDRRLLSAGQDAPVMPSTSDALREDLFRSFMEDGSLPSSADATNIDLLDYFSATAGRSPLDMLLKLKDLARKNPQWLSDFLMIQSAEALERAVSYLSGTDLPALRDRLGEITGFTDWSGAVSRGIWIQALKWLIFNPVSRRTALEDILPTIIDRRLLSAGQDTPVMPLTSDALREDLFRSFMGDGSLPSSADATNIDLLDYFSATAGRSPLDTLLKLKDLARENPQWMDDFFRHQSVAVLEKTVSCLSGTDLAVLRDMIRAVSDISDWPDTVIRGIWIQALKWLIFNPVSRRTGLVDVIGTFVDHQSLSAGPELPLPDTSETESSNIWYYLRSGVPVAGSTAPDYAAINRIVGREIIEKPTHLLSKIAGLQQADRNFAARFTRLLNQNVLITIARNLFGISRQLLDDMRATLILDAGSATSWPEALRWIVSDLIAGANKVKSTAGKRGKWSESLVLWYFLEYGTYPPNLKLSGRYSPGALLLKAATENPGLVRARLTELYRSGSTLITFLNRILSVEDLKSLILVLQPLNESEPALSEDTMTPALAQEVSRRRLSATLRSVLSGAGAKIEPDVFPAREQPEAGEAGVTRQLQYHDPEDLLWYYLEHGAFLTGAMERAHMVSLLTGALIQRRGVVRERMRKAVLQNRELPSLISSILQKQDFGHFLGAWLETDSLQWDKILVEADINRQQFSALLRRLLIEEPDKPEEVIGWIHAAAADPGRDINRLWYYLGSGRFQPDQIDREAFLKYVLAGNRELTVERLREIYRTRPGFMVRFVTLFNQRDQRIFIAHILGLDLAAWQILEDHMAGELKLKNEDVLSVSLRYVMSSRSKSEELLSGVFRELGLHSAPVENAVTGRLEALFWLYLEFGSYAATDKPITRREGNRILEQGLQSGNTYMLQRLMVIFKRDSALLLRLAVVTGVDTRRRLVSSMLGTGPVEIKRAERIRSRFAGGSTEDIVAAILRLVFSGKVATVDELKLALASESGIRTHTAPAAESGAVYGKEYLLWYFLEQGRYPSGSEPSASGTQELATLLLSQLSGNKSETVSRLRELFRYHPALMVHLSTILSVSQLRQLVAGVAGVDTGDWIIREDIIRSGTVAVHNPVRFQTAALGFLLSEAAVDVESLVSLMSAHTGLGEPESPAGQNRNNAEYAVWYFLEHGHHPAGAEPLSPAQFNAVLREISSRHTGRVAKRLRQIYVRTPEIISRMSRILDSSGLRELLSVILKLSPSDWQEVQQMFTMTVVARDADYRGPDTLVLKWWLAGEIRDAESLLLILRELQPAPVVDTSVKAVGESPQLTLIWFYLEHGRFPAGSVALTQEELASRILSAIEDDREDVLYRFRDLYRRNPAFLLRLNRPGAEIAGAVIIRLLDISDEQLTAAIRRLKEEAAPDEPVDELVLYVLLRMVMTGEVEDQSDIRQLIDRKGVNRATDVADITPIYQLWYYLDQGKRLAGSMPPGQMADTLLEAARSSRTTAVRQLRDLNSHSAGLFVRLIGLLSPGNLKSLVLILLNLDENDWQQLTRLPIWGAEAPDDNRLLTDLLRATLQGVLDDKSDIIDYLQQLPELAPADTHPPTAHYSPEALMWYYLDTGKYPPGGLPLAEEELSSIMLQVAARRTRETRLRLQELYRRKPGLLLKLSGIFSEKARRSLVARLTKLTDTEWNRMEDVLRVTTGQLPGKIINDTLRYLFTITAEINQELLQELADFIGGQPTPDSSRLSEEDYLWYFLENGRLFDTHSPDIQQLGEKLILLWKLSPGRITAKWKSVSAKTNLNNRLRQYYNRTLLEQIIRARYESTQVDLDLMAVDLLIYSPPGRRKISVTKIWDFMTQILLPQLHLAKHPYFIFEEILLLLSDHYGVDEKVIALELKDHPQVSQAGRRYALRASGSVTQKELSRLSEVIESKSGHAPDESAFPDNSYLTLVSRELRSVQELLSGALRWTDLPDASGTIAWLLKVAEKPAIQVIKTLLRDEWVVSRVTKYIPPEVTEIIQVALASDNWHEFLSVRDESVYYFDLILQERLLRHFNEAFFRISAGTDTKPSLEKTVELFLNRIVLHEHVTMSDLSGALKGKNTIGQGVLFRYIQKKYTKKESSVKPVLELVREASVSVDESVYIFNAGLVILHPYLSRYFDVLGLMEGKVFRDEESAIRAVHLLQYLATRQTETPEYMLVLNKILCGLPVDMPVTPGIVMTDQEVEVSESLLRGVLQNWKRMENSSIDNLSGAFLVREGRLIEKADRWSLHVKSKAYDILLEFMPWGFSRIKLSWMPKRMDVEWKTKA